MKKMKKKTSPKRAKRNKEIKLNCECDMSKKAKCVDTHTRMCGKEKKVYRYMNSGTGLPKWKKR